MTHLDDGADLRAVMERSVRDLDAPDHCGPVAVVTGRRLRRRRRAMGALSGVAACAAVTAVFAIPALGDGGGAAPSGPAASDVGRPTRTPSDAVPTTENYDLAGWWDMPSAQMVDVLESALPEGVALTRADTTTEGPGGPSPAVGGLSGTLKAGTGPGAFQIILWPPDVDPKDVPDPVTTTDAAGNEHTTVFADGASLRSHIKCRPVHDECELIRDDEGQVVGRRSTDMDGGTTYHEMVLLGPDGGGLYFYVADSVGEKPGYEQPSAELPPLSPDQLRALAEDPAWTSYRP